MTNNLNNGGMNMIDFKSFCIAMKAIWAYRLYKSKNETWTIIPLKYIENESCDLSILMNMNYEKEKNDSN